jgi:hypothetical protein
MFPKSTWEVVMTSTSAPPASGMICSEYDKGKLQIKTPSKKKMAKLIQQSFQKHEKRAFTTFLASIQDRRQE